MSITIKKIARDLNLAISTVSKALGDSHEISAETKKRVQEYVNTIDYVRNTYARNLKKKRTANIAVVVPEVADSYFSKAINGIEEIAQAKGYHVIIYITHEDPVKEAAIIREFRSGRVDGVLMSVSRCTAPATHLHELSPAQMPLVFFDRVCEDIEAPKVLTDDFESGYKATDFLVRKGCRSVAFIGLSENLDIIHQRLNGYKKALTSNGLTINDEHILFYIDQEPFDSTALVNLLSATSRPAGIVAATEMLAIKTYEACNKLKLRIPKDVKIIGFSNMSIASLLNPPLATITQPAFETGKTAAEILFRKLEAKTPDGEMERIIIPSVLDERESAGG
jgi:LacI family transcriptional regulator